MNWGQLRSLDPISADWGFSRGTPIDRHYIDRFVADNADLIRGSVMEIGTDMYTRKHASKVTHNEVTSVRSDDPQATMKLDLTDSDDVADELFDCIICTQTIQFLFDLNAAAQTLYRLMKPGSALLLTVPGLAQISPQDMVSTGEYWRFTTKSVKRLVAEHFPGCRAEVHSYGNLLTSVGLLEGIAAEELETDELVAVDDRFQVIVAARVLK